MPAQKPVFFDITPANINDITAAKQPMPIAPGATYVFDLGYYDSAWWAKLTATGCIFVTRLKSSTLLHDPEPRGVQPGGAVLSDQIGRLSPRMAGSPPGAADISRSRPGKPNAPAPLRSASAPRPRSRRATP
jgi:hypothetical protein